MSNELARELLVSIGNLTLIVQRMIESERTLEQRINDVLDKRTFVSSIAMAEALQRLDFVTPKELMDTIAEQEFLRKADLRGELMQALELNGRVVSAVESIVEEKCDELGYVTETKMEEYVVEEVRGIQTGLDEREVDRMITSATEELRREYDGHLEERINDAIRTADFSNDIHKALEANKELLKRDAEFAVPVVKEALRIIQEEDSEKPQAADQDDAAEPLPAPIAARAPISTELMTLRALSEQGITEPGLKALIAVTVMSIYKLEQADAEAAASELWNTDDITHDDTVAEAASKVAVFVITGG